MKPLEHMQEPLRFCLRLTGRVQGVGFRPFVYRLAISLGLKGWVINDSKGVLIDVEGESKNLQDFMERLKGESPSSARVDNVECESLKFQGHSSFEIRNSSSGGEKLAFIPPDLGTCDECLMEMQDPKDRRYRYPFINCTQCGPRFSIIEGLPYDRVRTTMRHFEQCGECECEYSSEGNRRFHAEPNACPQCGPHLEYWDS